MTHQNKERLAQLEIGILALFERASRNIYDSLKTPSALFEDEQDSPFIKKKILQQLRRGASPRESGRPTPYTYAKKARDENRAALVSCTNSARLQEYASVLVSSFITHASGNQMLQICPELIDDETPDIQNDIADILNKAEQAVETWYQRPGPIDGFPGSCPETDEIMASVKLIPIATKALSL